MKFMHKFFLVVSLYSSFLGAMCLDISLRHRTVYPLQEEHNQRPFLLTEKERIGTLLCGSSLGLTTALCGGLSGSTPCLLGGLGCLAATQLGLCGEMSIADKKKKQIQRTLLPPQYQERVVFDSQYQQQMVSYGVERCMMRYAPQKLSHPLPCQVE